MKNKINGILAGLAGGLVLALPVNATEPDFKLSADLEFDLTAETRSSTPDTDFTHGGRVRISATGETVQGDAYVRGVGQALLHVTGDPMSTEDVYLQFGKGRTDLQIGRFEAANLFPLGRDTYIAWAENGAERYEGNKLRGRASDGAQLALHYQASEEVMLEVATSWGDTFEDASDDDMFGGVRPVVVYSGEDFGIAAGFEYMYAKQEPAQGMGQLEQAGASVSFNFPVWEGDFNLSASYLDRVNTFIGESSKKITSFDINYMGKVFGFGAIYAIETESGLYEPTTTSAYATYTTPILDVRDAFATFAVSHSFSQNTGGKDDNVTGGRIRFNYLF